MNDLGVIQLTNGGFAIVDADLFQSLNQDRWHQQRSKKRPLNGLIVRTTGRYIKGSYATHGPGGYSPPILLSHQVCQPSEGLQVDHINGDRRDNTRRNLRAIPNAPNNWNTTKRNGNYTSKYKGVSRLIRKGRHPKWVAFMGSLTVGSGKRFLGQFENEEAAARAYDVAARKLFGEFARLNFPEPGERSALR